MSTETNSTPKTIGEAVKDLRRECALLIALTDAPEWGYGSYMMALGSRIESVRDSARRALGEEVK